MTDNNNEQFILLTPTWRALLPALVEVAANGETPEARKLAMDELFRLADAADEQNAQAEAEVPEGVIIVDMHDTEGMHNTIADALGET